jgi:hypothetical protein
VTREVNADLHDGQVAILYFSGLMLMRLDGRKVMEMAGPVQRYMLVLKGVFCGEEMAGFAP